MSIATAITAAQGRVADAYTAISNKGGTLPATQNLANMPTAIASIPSGTVNNQNKTITNNGVYTADAGYTGLGTVTVNVSGGGGVGITREVKNGVFQMPTENFTFSLPSGATDVSTYGLYSAFRGCTGLTSLDLSSLTTTSGDNALSYAFYDCTALTSVDLSSLTAVSGSYGFAYAFQNCTALTSVNLSSLTTISGIYAFYYAFRDCTALTSVDLSSLTTISSSAALAYAFRSCKNLTSVSFPSLTTTSFGSYTNQFSNMLSGTSNTKTHTLHFPSNLTSTISGLAGYPTFGGTSGYVTLSFDLPATS